MAGSSLRRSPLSAPAGIPGKELLRLLLMHPGIELSCITSRQHAGLTLAEVFRRFRHSQGRADPLHRTGRGRRSPPRAR